MKKMRYFFTAFAFLFAIVASFAFRANESLVAAYADSTLISGSCNEGTQVEGSCGTTQVGQLPRCTVSFVVGQNSETLDAFQSGCSIELWRQN